MTAEQSRNQDAPPLLSIGLPVYNGARHLRQALDSLLAQDVDSLELVISDNASTDDTADICRGYAAEDPRIRLVHNSTNVGAAANFNRVFELSRGTYFMWGSDDDVWHPAFARRCIDRLATSPGSVLCASALGFIDERGEPIEVADCSNFDTEGMSAPDRVRALLSQIAATNIYGVIRPSALRATGMMKTSFGSDIRLLLELLLLGDSLVVPETLYWYRIADDPKSAGDMLEELDPEAFAHTTRSAAHQPQDPLGSLARELVDVVRASKLDATTVRDVENAIMETLGTRNPRWRHALLGVPGLSPAALESFGLTDAAVRAALGLDELVGLPGYDPAAHPAWALPAGTRYRRLRNALLRLLGPFAAAQHQTDTAQSALLISLTLEIESLRRRVAELENRDRSSQD